MSDAADKDLSHLADLEEERRGDPRRDKEMLARRGGYAPKEQPKLHRLTCVESLVHQAHGQQPTVEDVQPYFRWLLSTEPPYCYSMDVTEEWQPINLGWFTDAGGNAALVGMLRLRHEARGHPGVLPTPESMASLYQRAILVGMVTDAPLKQATSTDVTIPATSNPKPRRTMFSAPKAEELAPPPSTDVKPVVNVTEFLLVLPNETARFQPTDPGLLRVRTVSGKASLRVNIYPG